eukprot:TRINITY_DN19097_c0_g1_i2.p1 TRINITY_DN19097_c0_g1~~TRINITY_DN19097_c0_g1_i2.p1  ORF type:complete len:135 (+),score=39.96 TRINITY_DN19097_c0_g1_i2:266-670(+)
MERELREQEQQLQTDALEKSVANSSTIILWLAHPPPGRSVSVRALETVGTVRRRVEGMLRTIPDSTELEFDGEFVPDDLTIEEAGMEMDAEIGLWTTGQDAWEMWESNMPEKALGVVIQAVSYTHLTLPTKRIV